MSLPRELVLKERRGKTCMDTSGEDHAGYLEVAHIDHLVYDPERLRNPLYYASGNLIVLCTRHHLTQHLEEEGVNGLTPKQNAWSIKMISNRLGRIFLDSK